MEKTVERITINEFLIGIGKKFFNNKAYPRNRIKGSDKSRNLLVVFILSLSDGL